VLVVAYIQKKQVRFYDSKHEPGQEYVDAVFMWLQDEHRAKKGVPMDLTGWEVIAQDSDVPFQTNGWDCGVFVTMACDFISEDLPLVYDEDIVTPWRKNLGAAILRGRLDYPFYF
jgi:Ulp1 family protease